MSGDVTVRELNERMRAGETWEDIYGPEEPRPEPEPTKPATRTDCPACGRDVAVMPNGRLRYHGRPRCPGGAMFPWRRRRSGLGWPNPDGVTCT